jgi:hypothetical protein
MNLVNYFKNEVLELKKITPYELVFIIVLILYLISNISTPYDLAPQVNNAYMYISLFAITILLLLNSNPLIAILFAFVAIIFLQRSKKTDHSVMAPSTSNKTAAMTNMNTDLTIKSLEEEMVGQIDRQPDNISSLSTYNPVMCNYHNASDIN